MRIIDVLQGQSAATLAKAVKEAADWRKTGVLTGDVLRSLVEDCGQGVDLRQVEQELMMLASLRWAESIL